MISVGRLLLKMDSYKMNSSSWETGFPPNLIWLKMGEFWENIRRNSSP